MKKISFRIDVVRFIRFSKKNLLQKTSLAPALPVVLSLRFSLDLFRPFLDSFVCLNERDNERERRKESQRNIRDEERKDNIEENETETSETTTRV